MSGYGPAGPWRDLPGQDLLAQSMSGLPWLSGSRDSGPVPVGLSVADLLASCHLAQGVTALLFRRERTGTGGLVETSLMEGDARPPVRAAQRAPQRPLGRRASEAGRTRANAFLAAPYGVYPTADGYLAIAMNPVPRIGALIGLVELEAFTDEQTWWTDRERIEQLLADHLRTAPTEHWLGHPPAGRRLVCAGADPPGARRPRGVPVARDGPGGRAGRRPPATAPLDCVTTRSPLRVDGDVLRNDRGAPRLGEHSMPIEREFGLRDGPDGGRAP